MLKTVPLLLFLCCLGVASIWAALPASKQVSAEFFKNVQGPPEEFMLHTLPTPFESAQTTHSASFNIYLEEVPSKTNNNNVYTNDFEVPVDTEEEFRFTVVGASKPFLEQLKVQFSQGNALQHPSDTIFNHFGLDNKNGAPSITYIFKNPSSGTWKVSIQSDMAPKFDDKPSLMVLAENHGPFNIYSNLQSFESLKVGQQVAITSRLFDANAHENELRNRLGKDYVLSNSTVATAKQIRAMHKIAPNSLKLDHIRGKFKNEEMILNADMDIILPNGEETYIPMRDDGAKLDAVANDGIFAAGFAAQEPGIYTVKVTMRGFTSKGIAFMRSTDHVFHVAEDKLNFQSASIKFNNDDEEMIDVLLHVTSDSEVNGKKFKSYAEVYGTSVSDPSQEVPVAFVLGMTLAQKADNKNYILSLKMSAKWLSRAGARLPINIKNAYVQDADSSVPIAVQSSAMKVSMHHNNELFKLISEEVAQKRVVSLLQKYTFDNVISEKMTFGPRPKTLTAAPVNGGKLVVVHGYCANGAPFSTEDFTDFVVFEDYEQSRTNDQFAQLLKSFIEPFGAASFISHSQGGLATTHLYTFYWSAADNSKLNLRNSSSVSNGNRIMQSVGSPYYGSGLAGSIASLGETFGVGCGKNTDLTSDGAQLWQSTIPTSSRKQVYYYTTQYKPLSWCNLAANAVLKWPNDGVSELARSKLEGANDCGHTEKQCHTANMKYPPQCKDTNRNAQMNELAAR